MATNVYTASYLLDSMQRRGQIPKASDRAFSRTDLLALMTEELQTYVVPAMMEVREEYFTKNYDYTTTNTRHYEIPPRAIGMKLRYVYLGSDEQSLLPVSRVEPAQQYNGIWGVAFPGQVGYTTFAYYLENNKVVLVNNPGAGNTLRLVYFLRPNRIVEEEDCGLITAIDTNTNEVTVNEVPAGWSGTANYDLIDSTPGFETLAMDAEASLSGSVLTFTDSLPEGLAVGDYVCEPCTAPLAQVPIEAAPLLTQRLVTKVLEAQGDPKAVVAEKSCERMKQQLQDSLVSPRTEGSPRYIVNNYGPGWGNVRYGWGR